jgi:Uma2 family endonuclease
MSLPAPARRLSEAEYLELERTAEFKSEFFDGETFAMAGGSIPHSRIAANLLQEFGNRLEGSPCVTYTSDLKIKVQATGLITYPDLSVICGPPELALGTDEVVTNPTVIVEVLSQSTEGYDRGRKFENYRQIPTLREYLLVSQWEPHIDHFMRQANGSWLLTEASSMDATLELPSLKVTLVLSRVFSKVQFSPLPSPPVAK